MASAGLPVENVFEQQNPRFSPQFYVANGPRCLYPGRSLEIYYKAGC